VSRHVCVCQPRVVICGAGECASSRSGGKL
jgi:hypothetical protein